MIRLLVDENIAGLERLPGDEIHVQRLAGRSLQPQQLKAADALWVRSVTRVDAALLRDSSLRFVGTATAGTEHIDQALLRTRGIDFAAAPGSNANAVVEYVLAALAELGTPWVLLQEGATLGIAGFGEVGQRLWAFACAMGWSVKVFDPWVTQKHARATGTPGDESLPEMHTLDDILACEVISLHCSLHQQQPWPSLHLIGERQLSRLGPGQWLVNAARGPVIDNRALLIHLRSDSPVNCVLDVWEGEPRINVELLACPTLKLATPHIAGYSMDAKWRATAMLYEAMCKAGLCQTPLQSASFGTPSLLLPNDCSGLGLARHLITQRYRIIDDDRKLRAALGGPAEENARSFDALRRDYPKRRELRGSLCESVVLSSETTRILGALGVNLAAD